MPDALNSKLAEVRERIEGLIDDNDTVENSGTATREDRARGDQLRIALRAIKECESAIAEAAPDRPAPAAAFEAAARAAGWKHGGDNGGIIYHGDHYDSWKAAVSWSPQYGPVYDSWQECCEAEDIEPGYPYRVEINYQTESSGNTYVCTVTALDDGAAIDKATAKLRADKRRRVMKIDGGSAEVVTPAAG